MTSIKALDCYIDSTPHIAQLKSEGFGAVLRYIFHSSGFKVPLTHAEALALSKAGIRVATIWENGYPNQDSYFTNEAAHFDAGGAVAKASSIGQPKGSLIVFAYDGDISVDVAVRYATIVHSDVKAGGYLASAYGSGAVLRRLSELGLIHDAGWLSQSKGFPGWADWKPDADVVQGSVGKWHGIDVDWDTVQDTGITWQISS
ncbi:MAG TPA: glycoside hydrolase domain-containing protein [Bryobacteraceae bacterium]|nr:glycoside hydrolase domain-containing protein [Bryobacteraceae bacterium]